MLLAVPLNYYGTSISPTDRIEQTLSQVLGLGGIFPHGVSDSAYLHIEILGSISVGSQMFKALELINLLFESGPYFNKL